MIKLPTKTYGLIPKTHEQVFRLLTEPTVGMTVTHDNKEYVVKQFKQFMRGRAWAILCEPKI